MRWPRDATEPQRIFEAEDAGDAGRHDFANAVAQSPSRAGRPTTSRAVASAYSTRTALVACTPCRRSATHRRARERARTAADAASAGASSSSHRSSVARNRGSTAYSAARHARVLRALAGEEKGDAWRPPARHACGRDVRAAICEPLEHAERIRLRPRHECGPVRKVRASGVQRERDDRKRILRCAKMLRVCAGKRCQRRLRSRRSGNHVRKPFRRRRGGRVDRGCGACSSTMCTLVPLNPNELTPPMRGQPFVDGHGVSASAPAPASSSHAMWGLGC